MWPVDAVVGENGAFYMRYDARARKLVRRFVVDEPTRRANRARLAAIGEHILRAVPGCALASDQLYREADLAIDFCEDVPALPRAAVERIVALMEAEGHDGEGELDPRQRLVRRVRQAHDDATAVRRGVRRRPRRERERFVFAGDSPNDAPMFAYFPNAVGVANVREFADRIAALPAYVTQAEAGAGFAELAEFLLDS